MLPEGMQGHYSLKKDGYHVTITPDAALPASDIITAVVTQYHISDIDIKGPQIEDVVLEVYQQ